MCAYFIKSPLQSENYYCTFILKVFFGTWFQHVFVSAWFWGLAKLYFRCPCLRRSCIWSTTPKLRSRPPCHHVLLPDWLQSAGYDRHASYRTAGSWPGAVFFTYCSCCRSSAWGWGLSRGLQWVWFSVLIFLLCLLVKHTWKLNCTSKSCRVYILYIATSTFILSVLNLHLLRY